MKLAVCILTFIVTIGIAHAAGKKPASIQWKPYDCSSPLMLPEHEFDVSQFGKGKYRIDGEKSEGHFNCIYIVFQSTNSLAPASAPDAHESWFIVKGQKVTWRTYKTTVEGRSVIRKEALMPNILPHQKQGNDSDFIWLRIDADSQEILDRLTPDAEGVIQDAAEPGGAANGSELIRSQANSTSIGKEQPIARWCQLLSFPTVPSVPNPLDRPRPSRTTR
ncbi:MAG: hypothetical protein DME44_06070 [Verrucomicrobia bacterium]|nr:MAG: hypothetical protein DME44_06070 [Verrucomicrobiota bacterium]